ncbi:hypothetical protein K469DRAFT_692226 [Zopfia rhizophila CBS 207.26]|uniref:Uncharacterized protein n=1 Tax=Zopfia rhizophila CBS 207.26 TaxID=1314779 RepID=A0A6A6DT50_9PEZI|nr:hypothetical protein K469DRAFT_692226 [Zopfia rhizophila CBS 207.26]
MSGVIYPGNREFGMCEPRSPPIRGLFTPDFYLGYLTPDCLNFGVRSILAALGYVRLYGPPRSEGKDGRINRFGQSLPARSYRHLRKVLRGSLQDIVREQRSVKFPIPFPAELLWGLTTLLAKTQAKLCSLCNESNLSDEGPDEKVSTQKSAELARHYDPFPEFIYLGDNVTDGLIAWIQIGINATADYSDDEYYSVAAVLQADGGHSTCNSVGGTLDGNATMPF